MRLLVSLVVCLGLATPPVAAETPAAKVGEGMGLIEEGAKTILRSLIENMQPKLEELSKGLDQAIEEAGPALRDLLDKIDDFRNYHPPEVLPNGDIIMRRKSPAEIADQQPGAEVEL